MSRQHFTSQLWYHLCRTAGSTESALAGAKTESPTETAVPKESDASNAQVTADTTKAEATANTTNQIDTSSDATVSNGVAKKDGGDTKAKT